jgi:hypothetical protein
MAGQLHILVLASLFVVQVKSKLLDFVVTTVVLFHKPRNYEHMEIGKIGVVKICEVHMDADAVDVQCMPIWVAPFNIYYILYGSDIWHSESKVFFSWPRFSITD